MGGSDSNGDCRRIGSISLVGRPNRSVTICRGPRGPYPVERMESVPELTGTRALIVVRLPRCDFIENSPLTNCSLSRMLIQPQTVTIDGVFLVKANPQVRMPRRHWYFCQETVPHSLAIMKFSMVKWARRLASASPVAEPYGGILW